MKKPARLDYIASVSHDLKSPLNGILSYLQITRQALGKCDVPAEVMDDLQLVSEIGEDMLALINNMLTAARIDAGKEPMTPTYIGKSDFITRVDALERTFQSEARGKGIHFKVKLSSPPAFVYWDILKIRYFAINNIISNALKFVGAGGSVRVDIHTDTKNTLVIAIADNGPGIPVDEWNSVFDKFVMASNNTRQFSGSGFGLSNAAHVVKAHKGRIEISEGIDGRGVTFTLRIPAVPFAIGDPDLRQLVREMHGVPTPA